jgi:biotin transport system substrate-specific component
MGLVSRAGRRRRWKDALALLLGTAIVYAAGVSRLKFAIGTSWAKALAAGLLPFIPGDAAKIAVAVLLAGRISPWLDEALDEEEAGGRVG